MNDKSESNKEIRLALFIAALVIAVLAAVYFYADVIGQSPLSEVPFFKDVARAHRY